MLAVANENTCKKTYNILQGYLVNMWLIFAISIILTLFTLRAYYKSICRGKPNTIEERPLWKGHYFLFFVLIWMLLSEIVMLASKEHAAETAITLLVRNNLGSTYPFLDNNLDIVSLTTLLAVGSSIYALCTRSRYSLYVGLLSCFIHLTRSFPGLLGTLSAYFSIIYPWSNVNENTMDIDTSKTIMYHGLKDDTYTLWSNTQCTQFVQKTNLLQFYTKNPESGGPAMIPKYDDLASQICYGLEFSMGAQCSCWISTLVMLATIIYILVQNSADREIDGFDCPIYSKFGNSCPKPVNKYSEQSQSYNNGININKKQSNGSIYNNADESEIMTSLLPSSSKNNDYA